MSLGVKRFLLIIKIFFIMLKKVLFLMLVLPFTGCTQAEFDKALGSVLTDGNLSTQDIASGLKEALNQGISKGSDLLSQKDGYFKSAYKILLPPEARQVTDKLKNVPGFSQVEDVVIEKINRGAEDAAVKAKPIFVDAIRKMNISDAFNILMGKDNAVTEYLRKATYDQLYTAFNPVIVTSLNKFGAIDYWGDAVNSYNKIPFVKKANPKLDDYVTKEALNGLFKMVEKEEFAIRKNKANRVTDLLKRVFAKQDNK